MARPRKPDKSATLLRYYRRLASHFGPQHWWPGESEFEVVLGALLVQNTAWTNVERALASLRRERLLEPGNLSRLNSAALRRRLRPAGTFRQKAGLVRRFLRYLRDRHEGSLRRMFRLPGWQLRADLLRIKGIGPETADSILLYGGGKPAFVVGEYTRRVLRRHKIAGRKAGYDRLQQLMEAPLPRDAVLYKEYHALLVAVGKQYCHRREPDCAGCPLRSELPGGTGEIV